MEFYISDSIISQTLFQVSMSPTICCGDSSMTSIDFFTKTRRVKSTVYQRQGVASLCLLMPTGKHTSHMEVKSLRFCCDTEQFHPIAFTYGCNMASFFFFIFLQEEDLADSLNSC